MATKQDETATAPPTETPAAPVATSLESQAEAPIAKPEEKPTETPANAEETNEKSAEATADKPVEAAAPAAVPDTPLTKLNAHLEDIFTKTGHREMWGVQLSNLDHVPTKVVLQKFLRANNDDVAAAEKQLTSALEWRKKTNPTWLVTQTFDEKKFRDLGFVTAHKGIGGKETIITWNIYGSVKDNKATFGDVEE